MTYLEQYNRLKTLHNLKHDCKEIPDSGISVYNMEFTSESSGILPGACSYFCHKHNRTFTESNLHKDENTFSLYPDTLKHDDITISENINFRYPVVKNGKNKANDAILLLHGLNEKYWDKYLPWAEKLVQLTGKAVILFPIAFHMNRSPAEWSSPRIMKDVALMRQDIFPRIVNSTFANAAISARIQSIPQRFFWSGLQTFYDIVKLIDTVRNGEHELISASAKIDIFAYSIGSFLSEILLMADPKNYFSSSRLFIFCGGPTLDRMVPNSRFILDSDATIAIYSFYTERLESELMHDKRLEHFFNDDHPAGNYFKALLSYQKRKDFREKRFNELAQRIYAVALKKDEVIPANEVLNTLKGDYRDIPVKVEVHDFPYSYDHITPFPAKKEIEHAVDNGFNYIFSTAADFFCR